MPPKRKKIDACRLLGNRRLTTNHVRAVLEAMPTDMGEDFETINVDGAFRRATEELYDTDIAATLPLQLRTGRVFDWPIARPQALVRSLVPISRSLRAAIANVPSSYAEPWHIVLYLDEVTPGNIATPMNSRKFVAFYWTFKEFGDLIRSQDFWFHLGVLRTRIIKFAIGGYGAMMKAVLHTFVRDFESFCDVGIAVDVGFGPSLLYAQLWKLLADGAALTAVFDCTGASGTKACFCCVNAIKDGTFEEDSENFVSITCTNPEAFILHTNASVWKSIDDVNAMAPNFNKTQFKRICQSYGFKNNPHGMMVDEPLREFVRPVEFHTQDWPHIFLQHGVGNVEMYHLFEHTGVDTTEMQGDVATWQLPAFQKHIRHNMKHIFAPNRRCTKEKYWKCNISEFLTVAPMVLNFVSTYVSDCDDEITSFAQLCFILDLIQAMKQGHMQLVGLFRQAVVKHFQGTVRIYGPDVVIPKHHSGAMHLADQFEKDGTVLDTLPVERLHQVPKGFGSIIKNLSTFEKSVLVRCIAHQRIHLEQFDERTRLLGQTNAADNDYTLSKGMYVQGLTIKMDDVVLLPFDTNDIAVVEGCGKHYNGGFFLVCTICDRIAERRGAAIVRRQPIVQDIWLDDNKVRHVKCWRWLDNGDLEVLLPLA